MNADNMGEVFVGMFCHLCFNGNLLPFDLPMFFVKNTQSKPWVLNAAKSLIFLISQTTFLLNPDCPA
ncbi:MAG: hypothetical protein JXR63_11185 [Spirochaetales bacterium]|nr:hypothetical protein [Spirochaetales bacterium]